MLFIVWEVHFHPAKPDHIFTCSEDGSLWHWDASTELADRPNFLVGEQYIFFCVMMLQHKASKLTCMYMYVIVRFKNDKGDFCYGASFIFGRFLCLFNFAHYINKMQRFSKIAVMAL